MAILLLGMGSRMRLRRFRSAAWRRGVSAKLCPLFVFVAFAPVACRDRAPIAPALTPPESSRSATGPAEPEAMQRQLSPHFTPAPRPEPAAPTSAPRPLLRCFSELPIWSEAAVADLLDRAAAHLEANDAPSALACAEEAARQAPRSIEANHDRAAALLRLGRVDDAREAVTLVLAMAPQDAQALELAADIFINHLPPSAERAMIGLEYAKLGQRSAFRDRGRMARLSLLEGQALIDLGRAQQALRPLERAASAAETTAAARYQLAVASFELGRFKDAHQLLEKLLVEDPNNAHASYHMGLVLERAGEMALAETYFTRATAADPVAFPAISNVPAEAFAEQLRQAVAELPPEVQLSLRDIPVEAAELPSLDDLVAQSPPLSPTILGLFRGLPLGQTFEPQLATRTKSGRVGNGRLNSAGTSAAGLPSQYAIPERSIVLYRRNLLRSVRHESQLGGAITRTLLHEVGHLLGEDDGSLRDRDLE